MFPLKIGRFQHLLKLGLALCFSIIVLLAFATWYCDNGKRLNQLQVNALKADILRQKTTGKHASSNLHITLSTSTEPTKTEHIRGVNSTIVHGTTPTNNSPKVDQPKSPADNNSKVKAPNGIIRLTVDQPKSPTDNSPKVKALNGIKRLTVDKAKSPTDNSPKDHPVKFILIMSYMRSGSSMTSELLQQSEYTFFLFEPFWGVYGANHRRPHEVCCQYLNKKCQNPVGFDQSKQGNLLILEDLFNCRFRHLPTGVLESFAVFYPNTGFNASNSCFPKRYGYYPGNRLRKIFQSKIKPICFDILEDMCLKAKVRLIKTIRLPLSFAENILERIPNLKIVHLIRDPRGMMNSRAVIEYIRFDHGSFPVKLLCGWMNEDLDEHSQLMSRFSERIILLFYDCLVMNPFRISKFLFRFIDLKFNQNVAKWITSHMNSETLYVEEFVKAGNSSAISTSWRKTMKFEIMQMIDRTCGNLYEKLGLRKFENLQDLRNTRNSNLVESNRCQIE